MCQCVNIEPANNYISKLAFSEEVVIMCYIMTWHHFLYSIVCCKG